MSTAGSRAYETIRQRILDGRFGPGERLKEEELTGVCEVSRTPVREALRRLGVEGLVVVTPHQGAQVAAPSRQEWEEIYTLRGMVEGHAAERAATRATPADIAELKRLQGEMGLAIAVHGGARHADFLRANAAFHHLVLEAARSPRLSAMTALVIEVPLTARTFARYSAEDQQRSLGHHDELIAAFEAADGVWAGSVMRSHVHAAYRALVRYDRPEAAPPPSQVTL